MKLEILELEEFRNKKGECDSVFVKNPFLYEPIILELKRRNPPCKVLELEVDSQTYSLWEVLTGLYRVFGISSLFTRNGERLILHYDQCEIQVSHNPISDRLKGRLIGSEESWSFNSSSPYIEKEPVIVLPEGTGQLYMEMDLRESEKENRLSIISNPREMAPIVEAVGEQLGV